MSIAVCLVRGREVRDSTPARSASQQRSASFTCGVGWVNAPCAALNNSSLVVTMFSISFDACASIRGMRLISMVGSGNRLQTPSSRASALLAATVAFKTTGVSTSFAGGSGGRFWCGRSGWCHMHEA